MFLKKSKKTFESCGPAIKALRGISFGYIPVTHQLAWKLDREVLWLRIGGMKQGSILYLHCHKAFLCMTCMLFPAHSEWNEHSYDKKYNWTTLLFLQLLTLTQKTNTKHNTTHLIKQHMNDLLQFQGAKSGCALRLDELDDVKWSSTLSSLSGFSSSWACQAF